MLDQAALERRVANLEKMIEVSRTLRSAFDLQSLLQGIIRAIVELVECERSSILLIEPETGELRFVAASGTDFDQIKDIAVPRHGSIAGAIAESGQPIATHNARLDPRFFHQVDHTTGQSTDSLMGVPLEIGGRVIGVLEAVNKTEGRAFDPEDAETLLIFASQAAAAIENTRLIEEQRQRLTESMLIQEMLETLSRFTLVGPLLEQLLALLEGFLGYTNCAILMFEQGRTHSDARTHSDVRTHSDARDTLRVVAYRGFRGTDISGLVLPVSPESVNGRVALSKAALAVSYDQEPDSPAPLQAGTRSALSVPMVCGVDVDLVGVIGLESDAAHAFSERDVRILSTIATQAAIGIRQAELYEGSQRANRLKQEFIATMSHELRTPLTVLIGYSEMVLSGTLGALNERQIEALKVVRHRADLLLRLLNDVLDFSKLVSGELKVYPVTVNLDQAVRLVVDKYRTDAARKKQELTTEIPSECQYLVADDQRLHQVLGHLVENAIKFSPDGCPITIRARLHGDGSALRGADYVRIDIVDQGIGIRPEDTDLVFEDFRQLDGSFTREYSGAGLGLAICKHLVELQGGVIWAESEYGRGSTFSFILPRA
jgi:signal transduction histidine kinase